ncbi:N,O-diacetyl muramidase, putative [Talaromyces stipitatus ATCC 10500]|uniref:Lysozyme n=1 Tax=Talaromyces stipitatus (strain ATCC 10500 / CBS 375.48 / QM 6759 / NRRL 1006) TaxID=441959 RepID=B8M1A1_TALSN|nr:N,O-diacetyl muramidase, putative [Talaromyces stipitatus ATCC 10500]EED21043.1 N,O-diacetyl muramidase, putative [Talaromyces stipitatus ATCC 10500]
MNAFVSTLAVSASLVGIAKATVQGFDISSYQPNVDFSSAYSSGARFVIIKATEGTTYTDSTFSSHYEGATNAGFIRGGYHFAHPDRSSGATQAQYFISHGGGWSGDGITLPGMLDIEYNPSGATCYGLSASEMVSWISDFVDTYHASEGVYPLIYTTNDWWTTCTGDSTAFSSTCPLVLARYASSPGTIPGGWGYETIWQNADSYAYGGDSDVFNGDLSQLKAIASG